jgi:hypothetical protein
VAQFHNDKKLMRLVQSILWQCSAFVETGAYCGDTSKWVAEQCPSLPVFTCEINPKNFAHAAARMPRNARLTLASSPDFLRQFLTEERRREVMFFFLDAHWLDYWPLRDELQIVLERVDRSVILVHDFLVPGRPNFSYCNGGGGSPSFSGRTTEGGPVPDLAYIRDIVADKCVAFYPTYSESVPGYVLLFHNIAPFGDLDPLEQAP